jgi:hypothetical protein
MIRGQWSALAVAALVAGNSWAQTQLPSPSTLTPSPVIVMPSRDGSMLRMQYQEQAPGNQEQAPGGSQPGRLEQQVEAAQTPGEGSGLGPTAIGDVKILQSALNGLFDWNDEKPPIGVFGWIDPDYTYRNSGHGIYNIAPVMNRFGDEFLMREIGLAIFKPLDPKEWSWGFNAQMLAGSDGFSSNPQPVGSHKPTPGSAIPSPILM